MATGVSGVSTLGMKLFYATETTAGTQPTTGYTQLTRINEIGGISISPEQIDSSALEDDTTRNIAGRSDTGGSFTVTVNVTNDTITEWTTLLSSYTTAKADGKGLWFEVQNPDVEQAWYVRAIPPTVLPMPDASQNELQTMEIELTIEKYAGLGTKHTAS